MSRMTMDVYDGSPPPKRGDRLKSPKTLYYVLHARKVKRKAPDAVPRYVMNVAKAEELEQLTRRRLISSACRRNGSIMYHFTWNPRTKKTLTFEQLMRSHG